MKKWLTFNEIAVQSLDGYGTGTNAPGRCSKKVGDWCEKVGGGGDSSTEPYIAAHNALLSHALAVNTYRQKFQKNQKGKIGLTIDTRFGLPYDENNVQDIQAAENSIIFQMGWFADPIVFGKYPDAMRQYVGNRLPEFTEEMSILIKGSYDFLGVNHYTTRYIKYSETPSTDPSNDGHYISLTTNINGESIGPVAECKWLYVFPPGMRGILNWINKRYDNPVIYVFENGVSVPGESQMNIKDALKDTFRVNYYRDYIKNMIDSIMIDGVKVNGYFAWSIYDNFEWADGFNTRFGMIYIDYKNNQARYNKDSVSFYSKFVQYMQEQTRTHEEILNYLEFSNN